MIGYRCKTPQFEGKRIRAAVAKGCKPAFRSAGAYIRGIAQRLLGSKKKKPNQPGLPPRSPTKRLKNAVLFQVEGKAGVVIGPRRSVIAAIGHTHEFGGVEQEVWSKPRTANYRLAIGGYGPLARKGRNLRIGRIQTPGQLARAQQIAREVGPMQTRLLKPRRNYPARPFMKPALALSRERIPTFWRNTVRGA
jgi:hypothetical protein